MMDTTKNPRVGLMEEVFIILGLIGVQIILSIYTLFLHEFLALGVNSLSLVTFGGLACALFLLPLAILFERKKWPTRLSTVLMVQMLLIAVAGVTFQVLILFGVKMTSPAIASATPNLGPVITFIIAACFRFEKFSLCCKYSRAKVLGTIVCLSGAITMSFLMSPPSSTSQTSATLNKQWILGCFYLLLAVIVFSCTTVLQAATMFNFPAPFSLCIVTALMGSVFSAPLQLIIEGSLSFGSSSISFRNIVGIVLLGAIVGSVCVGFSTWCVNKKGPVMVSIFGPVQTVCSAILSALVLRQVLSLGSLTGMMLMFVGLYAVLWAKKKEDFYAVDNNTYIHDIEKSLLV